MHASYDCYSYNSNCCPVLYHVLRKKHVIKWRWHWLWGQACWNFENVTGPVFLVTVYNTTRIFYQVGLLWCTPCPEKKDRQYFGRNFDKFRQLFIIFGTNHPDNPCDWKNIAKCPIITCTTLRNDDVIVMLLKNAVFATIETPEFILPLLRPPHSPDLYSVDYIFETVKSYV